MVHLTPVMHSNWSEPAGQVAPQAQLEESANDLSKPSSYLIDRTSDTLHHIDNVLITFPPEYRRSPRF